MRVCLSCLLLVVHTTTQSVYVTVSVLRVSLCVTNKCFIMMQMRTLGAGRHLLYICYFVLWTLFVLMARQIPLLLVNRRRRRRSSVWRILWFVHVSRRVNMVKETRREKRIKKSKSNEGIYSLISVPASRSQRNIVFACACGCRWLEKAS